jgi:hypothetical protein
MYELLLENPHFFLSPKIKWGLAPVAPNDVPLLVVSELIHSAIVFVPPSYCEMDVLKEQRVCIKFFQKFGKTATETYEMLQQAFGETVLSRSKTFEWYSRFKNGRTSIDDDPHTGRPSTARTNETVDRINEVIRGDRLLTIREIDDEIKLSFGTC